MEREFLKKLGLEDKKIDKIMKEHGKSVKSDSDKDAEIEKLNGQVEALNGQVSESAKELAKLKDVKPEDMQVEIDKLIKDNEKQKSEYEDKLSKQAFDHALDSALVQAKAKSPKAVKALLDLEKIKLDGEKLLGLDDQIEALKKSDGYQFDVTKVNTGGGGNPAIDNDGLDKDESVVSAIWGGIKPPEK